MGWAAILAALRLLASGAVEKLLSGLSWAGKWLVSDWRNLPLVILWGAVLWQGWVTIPARDRKIADTEALLTDTQIAHLDTIINFLAASAQAKREAEANVARVTAQQEAVTDATTRDLRSDLAAVSARFDRLRARSGAQVAAGNAGAADLPGTGAAPGRAAGAAPDQDLPAGDLTPQPLCPAGLVCLTIDEAQAATEDAHRQDRLIDWVTGQSLIRFAPEERPE